MTTIGIFNERGRARVLAFVAMVVGCMAQTPGLAANPPPYLETWAQANAYSLDTEERDGYTATTRVNGASTSVISDSSHGLVLGRASGNALAYAGYGVLGVAAGTTINGAAVPAAHAIGQSRGLASFSDVLHVNAPGLFGQRGTLIVPWALAGGWGGGLAGPLPRPGNYASTEWTLVIGTASYDLPRGTGFLGSTSAFGDFLAEDTFNAAESYSEHQLAGPPKVTVVDAHLETATVPPLWTGVSIIFGHSVFLSVSLDVTTSAEAGNHLLDPTDPTYLQPRSAVAYGDFLHTLRWGGVQQVLDASGHPVTGWTLGADSGTDYAIANTTPVPEPASWAMLLCGLGGLGFLAMRQRIDGGLGIAARRWAAWQHRVSAHGLGPTLTAR